jgi:hypothetical protein
MNPLEPPRSFESCYHVFLSGDPTLRVCTKSWQDCSNVEKSFEQKDDIYGYNGFKQLLHLICIQPRSIFIQTTKFDNKI